MMWDGVSGWGWMVLWMALFWGGTIVLVIWGVRNWTGSNRQGSSSPLEILEERYARGEIDREEFDSRRQHLRG